MTPSDRLLMSLPALLVALLVLVCAMPVNMGGMMLAPNIVWLATIVFARTTPAAWPAWLAFLLGLLQDVVFATPLGSQALIALALLLVMRARPARIGNPLLRDAWVEAAVLLLFAQLLLWVMLRWVTHFPPSPMAFMLAALVNIIWFPIVAWGAGRVALKLPK